MPQVLELDLSWNDMRTGKGLEMLGTALACGSLSSLQKLNLINCTAIKTLPDAIGELLEASQADMTPQYPSSVIAVAPSRVHPVGANIGTGSGNGVSAGSICIRNEL